MKVQISKIETGFSELAELNNRIFRSLNEADIAILMATAGMDATRGDYYKTDFTITWEDGEIITGQLDANRTHTFSTFCRGKLWTYKQPKPEWINRKIWEENKREVEKFSATHRF